MSLGTSVRADGLLKDFNDAGVLSVADVQVARRLGLLTGENDPRVLLAAALTVRSTRLGSVVVDLRTAAATTAVDVDEDGEPSVDITALGWPAVDEWIKACAASPLLTGAAGGAPLRRVQSRLWLERYWRQEAAVADELLRRSRNRPDDLDLARLHDDLDSLFPDEPESGQRLAVAIAALSQVSVIAGGPGTGKTTTVARLVAVLLRQLGPQLRVALAAPTGKAAARLEQAVRAAEGPLTDADRQALSRISASTLHRLLGRRPGAHSRFRYDRNNRLPTDLVIVDESSMVPLTMMARLLEALRPSARLVLVGDPDQLASVEAGAVLGDLVDRSDVGAVTPPLHGPLAKLMDEPPPATRPPAPSAQLRESVAVLQRVYRFERETEIPRLARLVRDGEAAAALELLRGQPAGIAFEELGTDEEFGAGGRAALRDRLVAHETAMISAAAAGEVTAALDALDEHRMLCAHRAGPRGVRHWTEVVERALATGGQIAPRADGHYAGQPLLVVANDYDTGLFNGDTGVIVQRDGELLAAFRRGSTPELFTLVRLAAVRPLHAMTVHRAQGSQFREVTVLLPIPGSPLATRQTFYTAITRAERRVRVIGSAASVLSSIERLAARATGLRDRLDGTLTDG